MVAALLATGKLSANSASVPRCTVQLGEEASLEGMRPFPDDNAWNVDISQRPIDVRSNTEPMRC